MMRIIFSVTVAVFVTGSHAHTAETEEECLIQVPIGEDEQFLIEDDARNAISWGMDDLKDDLQDLVDTVKGAFDAFDPEKLKEALADPEKLAAFASQFADQLQTSVNKTQQQLRNLQTNTKSKAHAAKAKAVVKITDSVTKFGRVAQNVAEQLVAKIESAEAVIVESLAKIKDANASEKTEELQALLKSQVESLMALVKRVQQAMHRAMSRMTSSLLEDAPETVAIVEKRTTEALAEAGEALDHGKTYIAFVNKTLNEAEAKALILTNQTAGEAGQKVDKYTDKIADELVALLEQLNKMLNGELDFGKAQAYVKSASYRAFATPSVIGAVLVFASLAVHE